MYFILKFEAAAWHMNIKYFDTLYMAPCSRWKHIKINFYNDVRCQTELCHLSSHITGTNCKKIHLNVVKLSLQQVKQHKHVCYRHEDILTDVRKLSTHNTKLLPSLMYSSFDQTYWYKLSLLFTGHSLWPRFGNLQRFYEQEE